MSIADWVSLGGLVFMGFLSWLTLLFIVLKCVGALAWSWLWVLSPVGLELAVLGLLFSLSVYLESRT